MKRIVILLACLLGTMTFLYAQKFPYQKFKTAEGKYGYYDWDGKVAVEPKWKNVSSHFTQKDTLVDVQDFNDLYGLIDCTGKLVIPCKWKEVGLYREGLVSVCNESGKFGFIDRDGNTVIPFQYSNARWFEEGLAAVMNEKGEWGFIDKTGFLVIQYQFNGGAGSFTDGLGKVAAKDPNNGRIKWGFIDKTGKVIVPLEWDTVFTYYKGRGKVTVRANTQSQEIPITGEFPTTEEAIALAKSGKKPAGQPTVAAAASAAPVKEQSPSKQTVTVNEAKSLATKASKVVKSEPKEEKGGLKWILRTHESFFESALDANGKVLIPESLGFKWIIYQNGYLKAGQGEKGLVALYRLDGSVVIPLDEGYTYILPINAHNGFIDVGKGEARGVLTVNGDVVVSTDKGFTNINTWDADKGYLHLGKSDKVGLYDMKGNCIIPYDKGYTRISVYDSDRTGYYVVFKGDYAGLCDNKGQEIISPNKGYSSVSAYDAKSGYLYVYKDKNEGLCDLKGVEIISPDKGYTSVSTYNAKETGYFSVKRGDSEGLCDIKGREIISPSYGYSNIDTYDAKKGIFRVQKNNLWGVCKTNGTQIVSPAWRAIRPVQRGGFFEVVDGQDRVALFNLDGKKIISESNNYEDISVCDYGAINCMTATGCHAYDFNGNLIARNYVSESDMKDIISRNRQQEQQRREETDAIVNALGQSLRPSSGSGSYNSSSSSSTSYSTSSPNQGQLVGTYSAFGINKNMFGGDPVTMSQSFQVYKDGSGYYILGAYGVHQYLRRNTYSSFLGIGVGQYNYVAGTGPYWYFRL